MSSRIPVALALVATLSAASCAANRAPEDSFADDTDQRQAIHVENGMPETLRVLALDHGSETMLGRVPAAGEATLRLKAPVTGTLRLVARPSGGRSDRRHVSEPIEIHPGQRITWRLRFSPGVTGVPQLSTFHVVACGESTCNE